MSRKLKIILPTIIGLLLILGIAWGVYAFITNTPKNTYLLSEKKTAKNLNSYVNDRFENEMKFQEKYKDNSYLSSLELSADVSKKVIKEMGLPKSAVDGTKIIASIGHDPKKDKGYINLEPTIVDEKIGKFQWSADGKKQYFESPFFKDIYSVKNSDMIQTLADLQGVDVEDLKEQGLSNPNLNLNNQLGVVHSQQDDIDTVAKRYTDVITKQLDDDDFKKGDKEEIKVDGHDKKVKPVTLTINREKAKKISIAVLKKAENDAELKRLSNVNKDEYKKLIKDSLQEIEDTPKKYFPKIESKIYEDNHNILKRHITITDSKDKKSVIKGTNSIGDDLKLDYNAAFEGNKLNIKGTSKKDGDKYKDKYTVKTEDDINQYQFDLDNKESQEDSKRKDSGKVTFDDGIDTHDITFNNVIDTDTKNNQQKQKLNIGFKIEDEPINIILNANTKLKEDINFDSESAKDFNSLSDKEKKKLSKEIDKKGEDTFKKVTKKLDD